MIKRLLDEGQAAGEFANKIDLDMATEILLNGMLGASVSYNTDKSVETLQNSINALIDYLEKLKS
jgi:hypothetical protein